MSSVVKLYPSASCIVVEHEGQFTQTNPDFTLDRLFSARHARGAIETAISQGHATDAPGAPWPLVQSQEVWAAGGTYPRNLSARRDKPKDAGGQDFPDRVDEADRPELFLKATPHRVAPPGGGVRIRSDSTWSVPEPELTLAINARGKIFGYTLGNDMTARDIEGENPCYLPQAKCYDRSASLGPCLVVADLPPDPASTLTMRISRRGEEVFTDTVTLDQIKRPFESLVDWLYRDNIFPFGAYLMTGTGMVLPHDLSLRPGDQVHIAHETIGTLTNLVVN